MTYRVCITCYEASGLFFDISILHTVVLEELLDICTWNETVGRDYICAISLLWFPYLLSSL